MSIERLTATRADTEPAADLSFAIAVTRVGGAAAAHDEAWRQLPRAGQPWRHRGVGRRTRRPVPSRHALPLAIRAAGQRATATAARAPICRTTIACSPSISPIRTLSIATPSSCPRACCMSRGRCSWRAIRSTSGSWCIIMRPKASLSSCRSPSAATSPMCSRFADLPEPDAAWPMPRWAKAGSC